MNKSSTKPWQWLLLGVGALLVFGVFNLSVLRKERLLERGVVVRLALAPRDPRSLMTGDYMALNYALATELRRSMLEAEIPGNGDKPRVPADGYAIVTLDAKQVAQLIRVQSQPKPVSAGEYALRYRLRESQIQIGTNAFFFEEGAADHYAAARYGEYRVDAAGAMLLVRMLDDKLSGL